ncbi:hypothetical protein [Sphingobacterium kitahiroshimense]|uniref:Uncharacterized protein n=1 Tax=Sphingobacterium kitahiroshimense TaxID=470446 RepID=A0ABV0BMW2_9SPHI
MKEEKDQIKIFKHVMQCITFEYRGYSIDRIAITIVNYIVLKNFRLPWISIRDIFLAVSFKAFGDRKVNALMTFPSEYSSRVDYLEIWDFVKNQVEDKDSHFISYPKVFSINIRHYARVYRIVKRIKYLRFSQKRDLWVSLVMFLNAIDNAERNLKIRPRKYVSFYSCQWAENLLTQFFKKRNIPTYNLQHGIFSFQDRNFAEYSINCIINSDYQIVWGELSKNELNLRKAGSVLIGGYPRKTNFTSLKKPVAKNCYVFLSKKNFDSENKKLLSILSIVNTKNGNDYNFYIKLHPSLNYLKYEKIVQSDNFSSRFRLLENGLSVDEILKRGGIDFCISVNTTTYYECYVNGIVSLRYEADSFHKFYSIANDSFMNAIQLEALIKRVYDFSPIYFDTKKISQNLNYVMGYDINNYASILNEQSRLENISNGLN